MNEALQLLNNRVTECRRCSLRDGCNQVVPGSGSTTPSFLFVVEQADGEADLLGRGLVGRAGNYFRSLLLRAGIAISQWYVTHLLKCVGKPSARSVTACKGWLWSEIKTLRPQVVIPLGVRVTDLLLKPSRQLKEVAGQLTSVPYMEARVAPWYAPAYLLQRGRVMEVKTLAFLHTLKEIPHVEVAEVSS